MAIFEAYLDPEDVQDSNKLAIYNVIDDSAEGMKKFIIEYYPEVIEKSIKVLCLESGAAYYAMFTTVDEESDTKLHWHVGASYIITV